MSDLIRPQDMAELILSIGGGSGYDFYYEEGEISLTSGSRKISFETENAISEIISVIVLPSNPSDFNLKACCYGFIYDSNFENRVIISDANNTQSGFGSFDAKSTLIDVTGSTFTFTTPYSYRTFPAIDYFYKIIYR